MKNESLEVTVASLSAIPVGEGRTFEVGGEQVAIFNTRAGGVFAVQARCPHKGGPLADGLIGEKSVVCPLHASKFDLSTGESLGGPAGACGIKTYPVRVDEQGRIVLTVQLVELLDLTPSY
jgi:nitrite reductase (NADH) small subunit